MQFTIDEIYMAIQEAETGGFENPWIRTVASDTEGGSSAFGPAQITGTMLNSLPTYKDSGKSMIDFNSNELDVINKLKEQSSLFLEFGNEPNKPGYEKRFDYGGTGLEWSDEEKSTYDSIAKKIMSYQYDKSDKNLDIFIESWRGAPESKDSRYYEEVKGSLGVDSSADDKVFNAVAQSEESPALDIIKEINTNI